MQSREAVAILSVAIVVAMAFVGVGYGLEYSGSSINSDNSLNVTYMQFKLNDADTCTFVFDDITYYRDRAADGTITYKSTKTTGFAPESESFPMKLKIVGIGATNVDTEAKVKLAEIPKSTVSEVPVATIKLQIYSEYTDAEHNTPYGDPIVLTDDTDDTDGYFVIPNGLKTDKDYWCIITVELNELVLKGRTAVEGLPDVVAQPSGTLTFDVVFYATAEAATV